MQSACLIGKSPHRLGEYSLALLEGEGLKGFVLEPGDFPALVVIANPALEAHVTARARVEHLAPRGVRIDGRLGESEPHQPPATGGMNTTASPAPKGRDQSENSLFTATFSCSRDRLKP